MLHYRPSDSRQAGGLNALKNISTQGRCENPRRPFLKASDNGQKIVYIIRPDCKLWSCEACAERRRRLWVFYANFGGDCLLAKGRTLTFVTLTSHRLVRTLSSGLTVWRKAWPKLSARWRRATPGVQYVSVPEHGKIGHFHVHLITTAELRSRWYKDNAAETGLGYQAKAVPIVSATECGGYIGKYLGKAINYQGWPPYVRRVNTSQKWPRPPEPKTPYEWAYIGNDFGRASVAARAYLRAGWTVETTIDGLTDSPY